MTKKIILFFLPIALFLTVIECYAIQDDKQASIILHSTSLQPWGKGGDSRSLNLDGLFYETAKGRVYLPSSHTGKFKKANFENQIKMDDGRTISISVKHDGRNFLLCRRR